MLTVDDVARTFPEQKVLYIVVEYDIQVVAQNLLNRNLTGDELERVHKEMYKEPHWDDLVGRVIHKSIGGEPRRDIG